MIKEILEGMDGGEKSLTYVFSGLFIAVVAIVLILNVTPSSPPVNDVTIKCPDGLEVVIYNLQDYKTEERASITLSLINECKHRG